MVRADSATPPASTLQSERGGRSPTTGQACPLVVAHRGGSADHPENTIPAVRGALASGADMLWLSVQVSRDGVPVLYRPRDLGERTDGSGPVEHRTADELAALNAGHRFAGPNGGFPYRKAPVPVPTLMDAFRVIPAHVPVLLDLKSPLFDVLVPAVATALDTLSAEGAMGWSQVRFYSTQRQGIEAISAFPRAKCFEPRDTTRTRLITCRLTGQLPDPPPPGTWAGYELHRDIHVTEEFTLGSATSDIPAAVLWDERAVNCFRRRGNVILILFGVDNREDYITSWNLGADAIMTDSPLRMAQIRTEITRQTVPRSARPAGLPFRTPSP